MIIINIIKPEELQKNILKENKLKFKKLKVLYI